MLESRRIGINRELMDEQGVRFYLVRVMQSGLPAEKAGIKIGDRIVVCNGASQSDVKAVRETKRLCQVGAREALQLDNRRTDSSMTVVVTAGQRPGL